MIKYVELTAPEISAFRQAKILSIECQEGDTVNEGDTLFRVKSGDNEIDLPATKSGRIVEMIATQGENITLSTALLLLETEVNGSTATQPLTPAPEEKQEAETVANSDPQDEAADTKTKRREPARKRAKRLKKKQNSTAKKPADLQQQQLDLGDALEEDNSENQVNENSALISEDDNHTDTPSSSVINVLVPDIGGDSAKVIEILVDVGDSVTVEDSIITLESDKASMDVPCTISGVVKSIAVSADQDVREDDLILTLSTDNAVPANDTSITSSPDRRASQLSKHETSDRTTATPSAKRLTKDITIPDIGNDEAKIIEILVSEGQEVAADDPLMTLESDKASMEVPSPYSGVINRITVSLEQTVTTGAIVGSMTTNEDNTAVHAVPHSASQPTTSQANASTSSIIKTAPTTSAPPVQSGPANSNQKSHASPSVRRFARELGADLSRIAGSGRKNRITKDDVKAFVKSALQGVQPPAGSGIPEIPAQDFSKFGDIEVTALNKIKRLTAENLHRSWLNVPHVTHNDEANISDLEAFRKQLNSEYQKQQKNIKLSPLAFIVKALVNAMQTYPQFNASLEPGGENLILKKYFHIGIAVDTPNGLVVPVIKDADTKSVTDIALEMGELAAKARDKKLSIADMSGACMTISSLGGIGGTNFTPIVNAPEVAILGVSRSKVMPVWDGNEFLPGTMLPLSLSYDHRVIDGAEAARFTRHVAQALEDVRRLSI